MNREPPTRVVPGDLTLAAPLPEGSATGDVSPAPERRRSRWVRVGHFLLPSSRLETSGSRKGLADETAIAQELLAEARERVRRLVAALVTGVLALAAGDLLAVTLGWLPREAAWVLPLTAVVFLPFTLLLWRATRSRRFSDLAILRLGLLYVVVSGWLAGLVHCVHEAHRFAQITGFGPYAILITIFPLLLPCPPRLTLKVASAAVLAVYLGFWTASVSGLASPNFASYADLAVVSIGSAAIAYTVSRLVFRMQNDLVAARRLGSYVLEEKIGSGGMGEVWRGRHGMLASPAAIKVMHPPGFGKALDASAGARFRREARVTAALRSPHTVHLYDFGIGENGSFFYAMELLDGIDLAALVRRFGAQPPARVRGILLQACDSLAEAHGLGLVHRDIKPENLMLCRQGRQVEILKVLDFGVVGLLGEPAGLPELDALAASPGSLASLEAGDLTLPGTFLGTLAYTAPETYLGRPTDARSDIYALGCVAYWLLTGRKVVEVTGSVQQIAATLSRSVASPSSLGFPVPAELETLVMSCLAKDPELRPQTADELTARLAAGGSLWDPELARAWWQENLAATATAPFSGVAAGNQNRDGEESSALTQGTLVSRRPEGLLHGEPEKKV